MSIILAAALKGSVLLLVAWMATRSLRRGSAAVRHLVWTAALGGMLLLPLFGAVVPAIRLPALPALPRFSIVASPAMPVAMDQPAVPAEQARTAPTAAGVASAIAWDAPQGANEVVRFPARGVTASLPLLWALGAALIFLRLALGTLRVSSWSRRARPVDDGRWLSLAQRLAGRMQIARPVILLRSERACVPMTWGVVYPTVMLPIDADEWTDERRQIVLLHELAHVKRLDAFTQLVAQVAVGVFWFNPLVWLAARQMRTEREHACDDFVLEGGARASDYANDLLQIARSLGSASAPAAAALAMARRSEFEGRLLAILDPRTNRRSVTRGRLVAASLAVVVFVLPLAALAPYAETAKAETASVVAEAPAPAPAPQMSSRSDTLANTVRPVASPRAIAPPQATEPPPSEGPLIIAMMPPIRTLEATRPAPSMRALELPRRTPPDLETLIAVARAAAKMTSDYEKAELLLTVAKYYVRDDELRRVYLDAVSSMTSDYDRSRTLTPLLLKDSLPQSAVAQVVKIAGSMTSDNDKSSLIVKVVIDNPDLTPAMRTALIAATTSMRSDYDRGRSLRAIVARGGLSADDVIGVINSAGRMTSGFELANTLVSVAGRNSLADPAVRKAYFKATEAITSPSDYRRAVTEILK